MKRLEFVLMVGIGALLGALLVVTPARADNRPGELPLLLRLNGMVSRPVNSYVADGGGLSIVTYDAGPGCTTLPTGGVYEMHCQNPAHFCPWGDDGGISCSSTIALTTYGRPVAASTAFSPAPYYFVTQGSTTTTTQSVCIAPAAGNAAAICAVFPLQ